MYRVEIKKEKEIDNRSRILTVTRHYKISVVFKSWLVFWFKVKTNKIKITKEEFETLNQRTYYTINKPKF